MRLELVPQEYAFNPTMVRLLHVPQRPAINQPAFFQSHNGAIAAKLLTKSKNLATSFQSHNGAIAAINLSEMIELRKMLSIPQWCDCCPPYSLS